MTALGQDAAGPGSERVGSEAETGRRRQADAARSASPCQLRTRPAHCHFEPFQWVGQSVGGFSRCAANPDGGQARDEPPAQAQRTGSLALRNRDALRGNREGLAQEQGGLYERRGIVREDSPPFRPVIASAPQVEEPDVKHHVSVWLQAFELPTRRHQRKLATVLCVCVTCVTENPSVRTTVLRMTAPLRQSRRSRPAAPSKGCGHPLRHSPTSSRIVIFRQISWG
jgi:hypothetical protein